MAVYYYYYNSSSWSQTDAAITSTSTTGKTGYSLYMRIKIVTNGNSWNAYMQVGGYNGMAREYWNKYWCTINATGGNKSWSYDDTASPGYGHGVACNDATGIVGSSIGTKVIAPCTWTDWYGSASGTGNITSITWGWSNRYFNSGNAEWTSSALSLTLTSSYIYNGSSWVPATPYIYNGSSWIPATAYIYNGSSWVPCK